MAVQFITADTHPDHDTICGFRRQNKGLLSELFVKVLEMAQELKALKVGQITVSVDGTIAIEILPDGTIKTSTDAVSMPNHANPEAFLREMSRLAGGAVERRHKHGHAHSHLHSHSHAHERH